MALGVPSPNTHLAVTDYDRQCRPVTFGPKFLNYRPLLPKRNNSEIFSCPETFLKHARARIIFPLAGRPHIYEDHPYNVGRDMTAKAGDI